MDFNDSNYDRMQEWLDTVPGALDGHLFRYIVLGNIVGHVDPDTLDRACQDAHDFIARSNGLAQGNPFAGKEIER